MKYLFSVYNVSFFSRTFQDFFFIFSFQQLDYDAFKHSILLIYSVCPMSFMNLCVSLYLLLNLRCLKPFFLSEYHSPLFFQFFNLRSFISTQMSLDFVHAFFSISLSLCSSDYIISIDLFSSCQPFSSAVKPISNLKKNSDIIFLNKKIQLIIFIVFIFLRDFYVFIDFKCIFLFFM